MVTAFLVVADTLPISEDLLDGLDERHKLGQVGAKLFDVGNLEEVIELRFLGKTAPGSHIQLQRDEIWRTGNVQYVPLNIFKVENGWCRSGHDLSLADWVQSKKWLYGKMLF